MNRSVRFLTAQELKRYPLPGVLTGMFYVLMGLMTGGMFLGFGEPQETASKTVQAVQEATTDWMFLCTVSTLGFVFTKDCFSYHRTDIFSRKLAFYRKLPIKNKEIVAARYLVLLVSLPVMSICYFLPLCTMLYLESIMSTAEGMGASVIWFSFSILAGSFYVFLEQGYNGMQYLKSTLGMMVVYLVFLFILAITDNHIIEGTLDMVRRYGLFPPVLSLLTALVGAYGMAKVTVRRLASRDLL